MAWIQDDTKEASFEVISMEGKATITNIKKLSPDVVSPGSNIVLHGTVRNDGAGRDNIRIVIMLLDADKNQIGSEVSNFMARDVGQEFPYSGTFPLPASYSGSVCYGVAIGFHEE